MKKFLQMLPHIVLILCGMILVFFFIDCVNSAMGFMSAQGTKILICILCFLSAVTAILYIAQQRAEERRKRKKNAQMRRRDV